jgi:hypothetical protein
VRNRTDKVKIVKTYGMFGLIDDRCDVLDTLIHPRLQRFWFGGTDKAKGHVLVKNWHDVDKI